MSPETTTEVKAAERARKVLVAMKSRKLPSKSPRKHSESLLQAQTRNNLQAFNRRTFPLNPSSKLSSRSLLVKKWRHQNKPQSRLVQGYTRSSLQEYLRADLLDEALNQTTDTRVNYQQAEETKRTPYQSRSKSQQLGRWGWISNSNGTSRSIFPNNTKTK
jgi:hypothetical protein